jgi:translation initiation factor 4E
VEDFWRYYHHIVKPTEMECNANCHFFKKEIKPMWEDDNNANGGKWVVVVGKQDRPALDAIWEGVLLSLIGETMGDSRELCGAVCSVRKKGDKIAVWTRNKTDEQAIMAIGQSFKKVLDRRQRRSPQDHLSVPRGCAAVDDVVSESGASSFETVPIFFF